MEHAIAAKVTYKGLFKATIFPIFLMVFTSIYSIVDGVFVANFAGTSGFAAINLVYPFTFVIGSLGFMVGTGGTALCAKLLGEKKDQEANGIFSSLFILTLVFGSMISLIGFFCVEPFTLGMASLSSSSSQEMIDQAILYGRILMAGQPLFMIQFAFHPFLMAAGKTRLAFRCTLAGGLTNMALDALFIGAWSMGVAGAAAATLIGCLASIIVPTIMFFRKDWSIHFAKPRYDFRAIGKALMNGISEFIANVSGSLVAIVYNIRLMAAYGENGASAYGIIMYVSFTFSAIFIGYCLGVSPMVSYQFGAKNKGELRALFKKSLLIIGVTQVVMFGCCLGFAIPFSKIFSSGSASLEELSTYGLRVYSISFLLCGISIFASSFFTALNNGLISGLISLLRTLVFQLGFVLLLPLLFGANGIWWSMVVGEASAFLISLLFIIKEKKKYDY